TQRHQQERAARVHRVAAVAPDPDGGAEARGFLRDDRGRTGVESHPGSHGRALADRSGVAHGVITYLMPVPWRTPAIASCTRSSGMRWVIRSSTGTSALAINARAAAL